MDVEAGIDLAELFHEATHLPPAFARLARRDGARMLLDPAP
jgi:hypothetical protein